MNSVNSTIQAMTVSRQQDIADEQANMAKNLMKEEYTSLEQAASAQYTGIRSLLQTTEVGLFNAATQQTQNMKF